MMFLPSMQSGKTRLPSGVVWVAIYPIHPRRRSMSCHPRVTEWTMTIQAHLPHLSKPQTTVLALWSLGMVLADPWLVRPLAVAVATLWLLSVGGEAEETVLASTVPDVTAMVPQQPRMRRATRLR